MALVIPNLTQLPPQPQWQHLDTLLHQFYTKTLKQDFCSNFVQIDLEPTGPPQFETATPLPRFNLVHPYQATVHLQEAPPDPNDVLRKILYTNLPLLYNQLKGIGVAPYKDMVEFTLGRALEQQCTDQAYGGTRQNAAKRQSAANRAFPTQSAQEVKKAAQAKRLEEAQKKKKKKAAEEKARKEAAEKKRKEEEAARAAAEKKRKEEEAAAAAAAARKKAAAEKKQKEEEAARKRAEAEAAEKKRKEEETARKRAEDERKHKEAETAEKKRKEEKAAEKKRKEGEAARKRAEEERKHKEAEVKAAAEKKRKEEEAARAAAAENKRKEEEAARKRAEEEEERRRKEAGAKAAAEKKRKEDEAAAAKREAKERARKEKEAEDRKIKEEARRRASAAEKRASVKEGPTIPVGTADVYVSLTMPNCKIEPSMTEYKALAATTQDFYTKHLKKQFKSFSRVEVTVRKACFGQDKPDKRYNVYLEWNIEAKFQEGGDAPDRFRLCNSLIDVDLSAYILQHVRSLKGTPFEMATGIYTQQVNTMPS